MKNIIDISSELNGQNETKKIIKSVPKYVPNDPDFVDSEVDQETLNKEYGIDDEFLDDIETLFSKKQEEKKAYHPEMTSVVQSYQPDPQTVNMLQQYLVVKKGGKLGVKEARLVQQRIKIIPKGLIRKDTIHFVTTRIKWTPKADQVINAPIDSIQLKEES